MHSKIWYKLPNRLQELRLSLDLSEEELASMLGVETPYITYWETNIIMPALVQVVNIALVLCVNIDYIIGLSDKKTTMFYTKLYK